MTARGGRCGGGQRHRGGRGSVGETHRPKLAKKLGNWLAFLAAQAADRSDEKHRPNLAKKLGNWLVFLAALAALAVGIWLLRDTWRGSPVAAAFTRVGGATRVETAVDASRFWLTPPQYVVETRMGAHKDLMLGAAQCAMVHDAPLLFTSSNPQRGRLVHATIRQWRTEKKGSARREVIRHPRNVSRCLKKGEDPADISGLSTPEVSNRLLQLPQIAVRDTLAPVVVFAAAQAPGVPPDVAVGLALAAHMASADREVSLVVVPRYLEADPELENLLRKQRELVEGGIVLGQPPVMPEDTRTLLRQLLTSTDRQGFLAQLQANLGSVGPLIAALLALFGLGVAGRVAPEIGRQVSQAAEHANQRVEEQVVQMIEDINSLNVPKLVERAQKTKERLRFSWKKQKKGRDSS